MQRPKNKALELQILVEGTKLQQFELNGCMNVIHKPEASFTVLLKNKSEHTYRAELWMDGIQVSQFGRLVPPHKRCVWQGWANGDTLSAFTFAPLPQPEEEQPRVPPHQINPEQGLIRCVATPIVAVGTCVSQTESFASDRTEVASASSKPVKKVPVSVVAGEVIQRGEHFSDKEWRSVRDLPEVTLEVYYDRIHNTPPKAQLAPAFRPKEEETWNFGF